MIIKQGDKEDISLYKIVLPKVLHNHNTDLFAPWTFFDVNSHKKPQGVFPSILRLPIPYTKKDVSLIPILDSENPPNSSALPIVYREVFFSVTSIVDKECNVSRQLEHRPLYTLKRECFYKLLTFQSNDLSRDSTLLYEYKTGLSSLTSKTWSEETSIELSLNSGFNLFGVENELMSM